MRVDVLVELKPTVAEAALRIDVSRATLGRVINEHADIGPSLAVWLERAGAGDWLEDGSPCRRSTTSPEGSRTIPTG
ncbi:helix-turn-helix domain-containing protein [Paeniglutamicibacter gangotriensis]|uniref:Addiction module antidote protein, HigA family n=1 Tax=Paeniglutamicibacter gangotriensis Lz1y TaxID=1276920 RepID=M7MRW5_9MICC|nr:hypothetical protein [Paeniglutamicibacter gangotriensis]EMQ99152.1 addiction module antidote protein, HigA family [Paeniglutamicibacter gangotriensis Lz1y]